MNTDKALTSAREIAMEVCLRNNEPPAEAVAYLMECECKTERLMMLGFDGIKLTAKDGRMWYVACPRERKPGKKQKATAYPWEDAERYEECIRIMEAARDAADLEAGYAIAEGITMASMKNEAMEGLEFYRSKLPAKVEEPEPAHVPGQDDETPLECYEGFDSEPAKPEPVENPLEWLKRAHEGITVTKKNERACWWVSGNTKPMKEKLKAMGFKWAPKKKMWYLKPQTA